MPTLLGLLLLLVMPIASTADEPQPKKQSTNYAELIARLASPNRKAVIQNGAESSVRFPGDYDVAAQKKIADAQQALHEDIEHALPHLVAALDDERYCMTISWADGDAHYNYSVGDVCTTVIASHLEVYREKIRFSGPGHSNRYRYPISMEWWEKRKTHRIADLQVEAIDWAIQQRKAEPTFFYREDRGNELAELEMLRDGIVTSGKPAQPRGMAMTRMVTRNEGSFRIPNPNPSKFSPGADPFAVPPATSNRP